MDVIINAPVGVVGWYKKRDNSPLTYVNVSPKVDEFGWICSNGTGHDNYLVVRGVESIKETTANGKPCTWMYCQNGGQYIIERDGLSANIILEVMP